VQRRHKNRNTYFQAGKLIAGLAAIRYEKKGVIMVLLALYFLGVIGAGLAGFYVLDAHYVFAVLAAICSYFPLALLSFGQTTHANPVFLRRAGIGLAAAGMAMLCADFIWPQRYVAAFGILLLLCAGECYVLLQAGRSLEYAEGNRQRK
jgi:hypothetical protein